MNGQRLVAHESHAVNQQRQAGDVIKMRVRHKDMVDHTHFGQAQIANAGTGIDKYIVIEKQRGCAEIPPDTSAAAQDSQFHFLHSCIFILS
jgi:hypothetical protein